MTTNLDALLLRPEELLPGAIASQLDPSSGVDAGDLVGTVSAPEKVQIVPTELAYMQHDWKYYGHVAGTYERLDMSDVFGTYDLRVMLDVPATASDLAALLRSIYQVKLLAEDIINEPIPMVTENGQTYVLKAAPTSTMWKGVRTVRMYFTSTLPG